jgi:hypothetical protein
MDWQMGIDHMLTPNAPKSISGHLVYGGLTPGAHRISFFINANAGTITFTGGTVTAMYANEMRK